MSMIRFFRSAPAMVRPTFALAVLAGLCSCTPPSRPPPEEGVIDVDIRNIAFIPKEVTIKVGERVRWTNLESLPILHTSTSGAPGAEDGIWDSGLLSPGESFTTEPFPEVGEFVYFCVTHRMRPSMVNAKVIVEP